MEKQFDFSGWATKANVKCSDGRIITKDAFKHNDGKTIPLVWNHKHDDVNRVLGHALLQNREEGVYAYCKFNDTESGRTAKLLVQNGDVDQLSIYANQLKQEGPYVMHGNIRELSLVLAGANPEAYIENVMLSHGDERYELDDEARIWTGEYIDLSHADSEKEEDDKDDKADENEAEKDNADESEKESNDKSKDEPEEKPEEKSDEESKEKEEEDSDEIQHADESKNEKKGEPEMAEVKDEAKKTEGQSNESGKTIKEVLDTFNEDQKIALATMIGLVIEDSKNDGEAKHSDENDDEDYEGGDDVMKHNVFEQDKNQEMEVISHSEMQAILKDIPRCGSLKESFLAHGIENIGEFFPEAKTTGEIPDLLKRNDDWVSEILNGVHRTPFARIKTMYADITADEARAKGYVKGNLKVEEVIKAFKRTTSPTTVYKKQKLDRDDVIDITEFDVVAFLRAEMRLMLNEEIARAILVGDGRELDDDDHINEESIRPIWTDSDVYTIKHAVEVAAAATPEEKAKAFIKACVKSRKNYKGSGSPVMYMSEDILTDCLLIEDGMGRRIYETVEKLAAALTVKKIVPVTVMDGLTRKDGKGKDRALAGIYVNLADYNVGADKGGAITMYDDFDIDYNAQKYLIETRCSGALTRPSAAVALEFVDGAQG